MKNKKGFTLVELIVVIAILGVILLLVVPNILSTLENSKKDAFTRQVQTVWKEAEKQYSIDYSKGSDLNIYSDSNTNIGKKLDLNKTDLTYITTFNEDGEITFIAVGNEEFCFIDSNPEDIEITRDKIVNSALTCDSSGCTCGEVSASIMDAVSRDYAYWSAKESGDGVDIYNYSMPSKVYYNVSNNKFGANIYVKTKLVDESPTAHEVCYYHNNEVCIGSDYWFIASNGTNNSSAVQSYLENEFRSKLGLSFDDCRDYGSEVICKLDDLTVDLYKYYGFFSIKSGNGCGRTVSCSLNLDGYVSCYDQIQDNCQF